MEDEEIINFKLYLVTMERCTFKVASYKSQVHVIMTIQQSDVVIKIICP